MFHQLTSAAASQTSAEGTGFKQDLLVSENCVVHSPYIAPGECNSSSPQDYLQAYGGTALNEWKQRLKEHDLSSARYDEPYMYISMALLLYC